MFNLAFDAGRIALAAYVLQTQHNTNKNMEITDKALAGSACLVAVALIGWAGGINFGGS